MLGRPMPLADNEHSTPLPMPYATSSVAALPSEIKDFMQRYRSAPITGDVSELLSVSVGDDDDNTLVSRSTDHERAVLSQVYLTPDISICFNHMILLQLLSNHATTSLYRPGCEMRPWSQVEDEIERLNKLLERWRSTLNPAFDFEKTSKSDDSSRHATMLARSYFSVQMIVNRPCLCRLNDRIEGQSERSRQFCLRTARAAVQAASNMLSVLPSNFDTGLAYRNSNWWCLTHHVMQATVILLCALSVDVTGYEPGVTQVLERAIIGFRWLHLIGQKTKAGERAWVSVGNMLRVVAQRRGLDVSEELRSLAVYTQGSEGDPFAQAAALYSRGELRVSEDDILNPLGIVLAPSLPPSYNHLWSFPLLGGSQKPDVQEDPSGSSSTSRPPE